MCVTARWAYHQNGGHRAYSRGKSALGEEEEDGLAHDGVVDSVEVVGFVVVSWGPMVLALLLKLLAPSTTDNAKAVYCGLL